MEYTTPDMSVLTEELKKAGADENIQIAGALWISAALLGIALPTTSANEAETFRKIQKHLEAAAGLMDSLSPTYKDWLSSEVAIPVERSARAIKFIQSISPGGHRQKKNAQFAFSLKQFFESEGLPIVNSNESPFVCIFAHCVGMDQEAARTTLFQRILTK